MCGVFPRQQRENPKDIQPSDKPERAASVCGVRWRGAHACAHRESTESADDSRRRILL